MVKKANAPDHNKLVSRRSLIVGGLQVALLGGLAGRLYQLQVVDSDLYKTLSDENRINLQLLMPLRGRIFDRFGYELAGNRQSYRLVIIPEQVNDMQLALESVSRLVVLSEDDQSRLIEEIKARKSFIPITLRENLTWSEVSRIEVNAPYLPGVSIESGKSRFYTFGSETAHLVGYVGSVSQSEIKKSEDPAFSLPGFQIGKTGIENRFDDQLRGQAGNRHVEINAVGRVIRELQRDDGLSGDDHVLTIDIGLQQYTMSRLGNESAGCVVIDIHTGEVLSIVSAPAFDPNSFASGISKQEWDSIIENPRFPLNNKAISGQYPPGSTFKMLVALAALESGLVGANTTHFCEGHIELGDTKFHCWKPGGHGRLSMEGAIERSCDVYFYEIAKRIGLERISNMARRFGFGSLNGIDLPNEKEGLVPTALWKKNNIGESWRLGETLIVGIGQGYLLATPLQLAVMVSRIANGGIGITPKLVRAIHRNGSFIQESGKAATPMNIPSEHLAIVKRGMERVTNSPTGTAYAARIENPRFAMAGKTGSSQVRRISESERELGVQKNEDLVWKERDHALFVGYAPLDSPRYAVSVVIEHGGGGASTAAPIARDILMEVQRRDPANHEDLRIPISAQYHNINSGRKNS
tara:strand:+ start:33724 stop:35637 length:1914 start_codon:yes stop_codon:yes gene_type:complete